MELLAGWIKSIIAAIVLAGFLEMLLPNNELKGVTRMVMGLLIILILAQPLLKVFNISQELTQALPGWQNESDPATTGQIVTKGLNLRNQWLEQFAGNQQQAYEERIARLLRLSDGIAVREVRVVMAKQTVQSVSVAVRARSGTKLDGAQRAEWTAKLDESIQLVCPVTKERIEVVWDE